MMLGSCERPEAEKGNFKVSISSARKRVDRDRLGCIKVE
jgi:hypothetical protein